MHCGTFRELCWPTPRTNPLPKSHHNIGFQQCYIPLPPRPVFRPPQVAARSSSASRTQDSQSRFSGRDEASNNRSRIVSERNLILLDAEFVASCRSLDANYGEPPLNRRPARRDPLTLL